MLYKLNLWIAMLCLSLSASVSAGHHESSHAAPEQLVTAAYATFATGDTAAYSPAFRRSDVYDIRSAAPVWNLHRPAGGDRRRVCQDRYSLA